MRAAILLLLAALPPATAPLPVTAWARSPLGVETQLLPGAVTEVAPASILEIRSDQALATLRVRFTGENGVVVPSHDTAQIGQGTLYRVAPEEPLPPGSRFRIEIGVDGAEFLSATFDLHTTGVKPSPPAPARRRRR